MARPAPPDLTGFSRPPLGYGGLEITVLRHSVNNGTRMTAPLKAIDGSDDLAALMNDIGRRAKAAARTLALASPAQKNRALAGIAKAIRADAAAIIAAN